MKNLKLFLQILSMSNRVMKAMRIKLTITALSVYILLSGTNLLAGDKAQIKWKEVPLAEGYQVEIKNMSNQTVLIKKTSSTELDITLPAGDYKIRILALNKFKKVSVSSEWSTITLKKALSPDISSIAPLEFNSELQSAAITVTGSNFQKGCSVSLEGRTGTFPVTAAFISPESLFVSFSPANLETGYYKIIIVNPGNREIRSNDSINIGSNPAIYGLSRSTLTPGEGDVEITITGNRFAEECSVALMLGNELYKPEKVSRQSETSIFITINPDKLSAGIYSLIISNTDNFSKTVSNVITVTPKVSPPKKTKHAFTVAGLSKRLGVFIGAGGSYNFLLPEWNRYGIGSFYGFNFYIGFENPVGKRLPIIKNLGVELIFDFMQYPLNNSNNLFYGDLTTYIVSGGLFYANNYGLPVYFVLRGGAGIAYSVLRFLKSSKESSISLDPYLYAGFAVRYIFLRYGFMEVGSDYQHISFIGKKLHSVRMIARIGTTF